MTHPGRKGMKRITALLASVLAVLCLAGCFGSREKPLTDYFHGGEVLSARYYCRDTDGGYYTEELDPAQIPAMLDRMGSMDVQRYSFHTDYFWGGRFGIELEMEDGTFICYDGTRLIRQSVPMTSQADEVRYYDRVFLEVTNCDFWEAMRDFFPGIRHET